MKLRRVSIVLCVLLILSLLAGCSAAPAAGKPQDFEPSATVPAVTSPASMPEYGDLTTGTDNSLSTVPTNQKLIRTVYMEAETDDLDVLISNVTTRVASLGGYIEHRQVYNGSQSQTKRVRNASLTIRIPAPQLDAFVHHVSEQSNIISSNETTEDVTLTYVEIEGRVTALETQQARLLELLAQAETMEDLLTIERELTDVRTELEQMKSKLRVYENLVDYGTVHLSVQEVKEYTVVEEEEPTFWEEISQGFTENMESMGEMVKNSVILLITSVPYFIPLIVVAAVVLVILRFTVFRKKKKAEEPPKEV